jgi:hypothetical protein
MSAGKAGEGEAPLARRVSSELEKWINQPLSIGAKVGGCLQDSNLASFTIIGARTVLTPDSGYITISV